MFEMAYFAMIYQRATFAAVLSGCWLWLATGALAQPAAEQPAAPPAPAAGAEAQPAAEPAGKSGEEPAAPPASNTAADKPAAQLSLEQEQIAERYRRLEELMLRMAELTAAEDPARAALLRQAVAKSKERLVGVQFERIVELLNGDRLSTAVTGQTDIQKDLKTLLELLLNEDRADRLKSDQERVRGYLKEVNKLIKEQQGIQAQTNRDAQTGPLADRQGKLSDRTGKLGQQMRDEEAAAQGKSPDDKEADESSDGKSGEGKSAGESGDGKQGDSKQGEGKSSDGKPADGKSGGDKPGDSPSDKPGEAGDPDQKPGEQSDGKPSDGKPAAGEPQSGEQSGKPGESEPSESSGESGKPGESGEQQSGKPQPGSPSPGEGGEPSGEPGAQSPPPENEAQQRVAAAQQRMKDAQEKLEKALREEAAEKQEEALRELEAAKADLEKILRQMREEEMARLLAMLEARFRKMLAMQVEVYEGTIRLDRLPAESRGRGSEIEAGRLSRAESQIAVEADKALTLLHEEGTAVAMPEALEQTRDDMRQVTARLAEFDVAALTQGIEEDIIASLEEMIAALEKAQEDLEKEQSEQQPPPPPGDPQEPPLVDQLAELRMIRSLQMRVNRRTQTYSKLIDGEQADKPELLDALRDLAERQNRIYRTTRDIVAGKNE